MKKTHSVSAYLNWNSVLHHLSNYCVEENVSIATCLSHELIFEKFIKQSCPKSRKSVAVTIFKTLFSLHSEVIGCKLFDIYHSNFGVLIEPSQEEQTLVIPSRLLSHCINTSKAFISDFLTHVEGLKKLTLILHRESAKYSGVVVPLSKSKIPTTRVQKLIAEYGLGNLSDHHNWSSATQFSRYLSEVQFASKTLIHAYSGMRDDEAYSLLPGCLSDQEVDGVKGYWLHGYTTKGYGRREPAAWVTSVDVIQAIAACEHICSWIRRACTIKNDIPLFSNVSHFAFSISHNRTKVNEGKNKLANLTHITFNRIFDSADFIITEEDAIEIQFIEYARNWDAETSYVTGSYWNFNTHQFRRSLAYYGIETGLVRYSSLHEQLQHIRMRMTTHYSKGGTNANALVGSSKLHFKHELNRVTSIVKGLDYVKTILLSDETLVGGHGRHVERNIKPLGKVHILENRGQTVDHVRAGLIAFTPRASGGCLNPNPCHLHLIHPLSARTGCAQAALIPSRVRLAVSNFKNHVATLQPNSPEFNTAIRELEITTDQLRRQNIEIE
ncbi:hypothetical protein HX817_10720 [Pseudomonas sp. C6002]|uniref:hypothetical protein n=1 Tax=Pseudomonas sp. C6002 TaxID=2738814 RepID=UPI0015A345EA|nr:hypothetical protein [Pseudomonas sp. C6002]NWA32010.1 hypothetical protein [Pseudomonas sp. C6002]